MHRTPSILIVSPDPRLEDEVAEALAGVVDISAVLHCASELRQGVEAARSRHPDFILVEMGKDLRSLKAFAEEVAKVSPHSSIAAVFSSDLFGPDVSESALLIEALRAGIQDFLRRPLSRMDVEQLLDRLHRKPSVPTPRRSGKIVSFLSNKGGVGKSTISLNVACGLARRHPDQVLLVDASLQMGVAACLLDVNPATSLTDAARQRDRLDETLLRQLATPHSCGLHLLAAPAGAVEAAEIDDEVMSRVLTLARHTYDYVIVDSFPLLDRVMMAVLDLSERAYVVLEAVVPTVLGVAQMFKLLESLGVPSERLRVVLNRYTASTDNLKPADVAKRLGRHIDYVLPFQKNVSVAANVGRPYILSANSLWGLGKTLGQLVQDIEAMPRSSPHANPPTHGGEAKRGVADKPPSVNGAAAAPIKGAPHEH
jgi:pilus assembly protein CpaE